MDGELINDILSAMCEEIDSAECDIENYECGGIDNLFENFSDYAKLRGFVWGMRRAIFLLKYRAKNAGIEVM